MKTTRAFILYLGLFVGWVIFGWQLVVGVNSLVKAEIKILEPQALFISFLLMMVYFAIQIFNWFLILIGIGGKASWSDVARGFFLSFIPRYIPGTVWGYISRSEWMLTHCQISYRLSGMASLVEVIVSGTSALFILGITSFLVPGIGIEIGIVSIFIPLLVWVLVNRLGKVRTINVLKTKIVNPIIPFSIKVWISSHLIFFLQWIIFGTIYWLLIVSFSGFTVGAVAPLLGIIYSIFAFTLAWIIGFIMPFLPGGLGVREFVLASMTASLFNLEPDKCSMIAVSLRILSSIVEIGLVLWGLKRIKPAQNVEGTNK